MATEPRPMDPERLADARAFSRAWRGERDESGDIIEGPEWDTDDIVWALRDLLDDRDYQAQRADAAELHEERLRKWLNEAEADLRRPAPFSVREAIREAGLDEGLSSAEGIRALAAEVARLNREIEERTTAMETELAEALGLDAGDTLIGWDEMLTSARDARAEVARLRSRVRVEAEDVERAGVTREKCEAWAKANGHGPIDWDELPERLTAHHVSLLITSWAFDVHGRDRLSDRWRILDEMARMEVPK